RRPLRPRRGPTPPTPALLPDPPQGDPLRARVNRVRPPPWIQSRRHKDPDSRRPGRGWVQIPPLPGLRLRRRVGHDRAAKWIRFRPPLKQPRARRLRRRRSGASPVAPRPRRVPVAAGGRAERLRSALECRCRCVYERSRALRALGELGGYLAARVPCRAYGFLRRAQEVGQVI